MLRLQSNCRYKSANYENWSRSSRANGPVRLPLVPLSSALASTPRALLHTLPDLIPSNASKAPRDYRQHSAKKSRSAPKAPPATSTPKRRALVASISSKWKSKLLTKRTPGKIAVKAKLRALGAQPTTAAAEPSTPATATPEASAEEEQGVPHPNSLAEDLDTLLARDKARLSAQRTAVASAHRPDATVLPKPSITAPMEDSYLEQLEKLDLEVATLGKTKGAPTTEQKERWKAAIAAVTDLRSPEAWYPYTRQLGPRKFILHIGPTNSGKTHAALQALKAAESGVYCGPLRLLAEEIHVKLSQAGVRCKLVTGQKIVDAPGATHVACTVEMTNLSQLVDVAVIDEYQLIGERDRGWAWTRAILGLPAKIVHLCGDPSAVGIVRDLLKASKLANWAGLSKFSLGLDFALQPLANPIFSKANDTNRSRTGDEVEVQTYTRLSPLRVAKNAISRPTELQNGDCVVVFSKKELYKWKTKVERSLGGKVSVVYGDLPPDARTSQAALFNKPDSGQNILIATDAIGLGLNLNIRRLIFSTIRKFDGISQRQLTVKEVKQIAGRAGRFGGEYPEGIVSAVHAPDLDHIRKSLAVNISPETTPTLICSRAGLFPLLEQLALFDQVVGGEAPYSSLLSEFYELAQVDAKFFLCDGRSVLAAAQLLDDFPLSLKDKYTMSMAPLDTNSIIVRFWMRRFARDFIDSGTIYAPSIPEILRREADNRPSIEKYEVAHKVAELYIWLGYRYPAEFSDRDFAEDVRAECSTHISHLLSKPAPGHDRRPLDLHRDRSRVYGWRRTNKELNRRGRGAERGLAMADLNGFDDELSPLDSRIASFGRDEDYLPPPVSSRGMPRRGGKGGRERRREPDDQRSQTQRRRMAQSAKKQHSRADRHVRRSFNQRKEHLLGSLGDSFGDGDEDGRGGRFDQRDFGRGLDFDLRSER